MKNNDRGSIWFALVLVCFLFVPGVGRAIPSAATELSSVTSASDDAGSGSDTSPARKMPLPRGLDFWQKERDAKAARGWEYEFDYSGEYLKVLKCHHGTRKQVYLDNLNLKLGVDLEKANLGSKGRFFLYVLGNSGGNLTGEHLDDSGLGRIGDLQTLSNIETNETFRLYEAFFEFPIKKWSLLAGLRDLNADFYNSEYAAFFSNSSFGIGPNVSKNAPVSIFNVTSPALRLKYEPNAHWTFEYGIWDGYPGTPDENKRGFGIRITPRHGFMNITEVQYHHQTFGKLLPGTIKLGTWHHTGRFDDLVNVDDAGDPVKRRHNWGHYLVIDQKLWSNPKDAEQGIGGFVQVGGGEPNDRSLVEGYVGVGLNFMGPLRGRPKDVFGVAWNSARTSGAARAANRAAGTLALDTEKVLEIGYRIQVNDWLTIKPNLQIIKAPGADPTLSESRVFGLRFNTIF